MVNTVKRVFLTTLLLSSLLYLSLPNLAYAVDDKDKEPTTEKVNVESNGAVAEPPSGPNTKVDTIVEEVDIETPASVTGKKVQGTGTVTDFSTNGSRAFYTITDNDSKVFYLIIDLDKTENNVYFLSDVSKSDLQGSIESKEQPAPVMPQPQVEEKQEESGNGTFFLMIFLVGVIIVTVYYFRVFKKKKEQGNTNDEDEMQDDYYEEEIQEDKKDN